MEKVRLQQDHLEFRYMGQDPALPGMMDVGWLSTEEKNEMRSHEMKANFYLLQRKNLLGKYGPARKQYWVAKVIYASCSQF